MEEEKRVVSDGGYLITSTDQQSSVEISKNAKGEYAWKVKVYSDYQKVLEEKLANYINIAINATQG